MNAQSVPSTSKPAPVLELRGLAHDYAGRRLLDGLTLAVEQGEVLALLGANGTGKTTLLKIIAGLLRPRRGEVWLDGQPATDWPPHRRRVGMVFQSPVVYPHLRVAANIGFPLKALRVGRAERRRKVLEVARAVGVEPLLERFPAGLSGGEQQRVALARAIVGDPRLLLLDEPFSNLDSASRAPFSQLLRRIVESRPLSVLLVTHEPGDVWALASRVAALGAEGVWQVGTPDELYRTPRTLAVAQLLGGPLNLLPGCLRKEASRWLLDITGAALDVSPLALRCPDPAVQSLADGDDCEAVLAVRPRDVDLLVETVGDRSIASREDAVGLSGTVLSVGHRPDQLAVEVAFDGRQLTVECAPGRSLPAGARVSLTIPLARSHLFVVPPDA